MMFQQDVSAGSIISTEWKQCMSAVISPTFLSHWDLVFPNIPELPASIIVCKVKYADCDLIQYIPVQIRAVSF